MRLSVFFVLLLAPVRGWTEGQLPAGACAPGSVQSCAPAGVFTTAPAPGHGTAQVPGSESFTFTAADVVHSSEPPRAPELSGAVPFAPGEWTVPPWDGPWKDGDGTLPGMIPGWTTPGCQRPAECEPALAEGPAAVGGWRPHRGGPADLATCWREW